MSKRKPPIGLYHSEKIPHPAAGFSYLLAYHLYPRWDKTTYLSYLIKLSYLYNVNYLSYLREREMRSFFHPRRFILHESLPGGNMIFREWTIKWMFYSITYAYYLNMKKIIYLHFFLAHFYYFKRYKHWWKVRIKKSII